MKHKITTILIAFTIITTGVAAPADVYAAEDSATPMGTIGWMAFVTVVFALAGSLLFVHIARRLMGINRKGERTVD